MSSGSSSCNSPVSSPVSTAPSSIHNDSHDEVNGEIICPISTDYTKWRPCFHQQPRSGWMNDPCAPAYNPRTKTFHLFFQWNPNGPDWGDICWGHLTSPDLISWTSEAEIALKPDRPYDARGVFTGCIIPNAHRRGSNEPMVVAYTSVNALPIHHTLPHGRGSESLSLAYSDDHGSTWMKSEANPILPCEPEGIEVTGWRDPYVNTWASMSRLLGAHPDTLYGIVSGGIRDDGPTTFLYSIGPEDLKQWDYLGPLTQLGLNNQLSRWSGDMGKNWEVTNFVTLNDEVDSSVTRDFLVLGAEGCIPSLNHDEIYSATPSRPSRGQLWMSGSLCKNSAVRNSAASMACESSGYLDHGCFYAANSFFDPTTETQVAWGWITEEDLCDELRHAQGWSGLLSLPRELFMQTLTHIVGSIGGTPLQNITSLEKEPDSHGSFTVRTLASRPVQRVVEDLRQGHNVHTLRLGQNSLAGGKAATIAGHHITTRTWELDCSFRVSSRCRQIGIRFVHSAGPFQSTTLLYEPRSETFTITRPSFPVPDSKRFVNSAPEVAPFTLLTFQDTTTHEISVEPLQIQMWRDNSVLEVFVNGRAAISTRIYAAEQTLGVEFFAEDTPIRASQTLPEVHSSELMSAVFRDLGIA